MSKFNEVGQACESQPRHRRARHLARMTGLGRRHRRARRSAQGKEAAARSPSTSPVGSAQPSGLRSKGVRRALPAVVARATSVGVRPRAGVGPLLFEIVVIPAGVSGSDTAPALASACTARLDMAFASSAALYPCHLCNTSLKRFKMTKSENPKTWVERPPETYAEAVRSESVSKRLAVLQEQVGCCVRRLRGPSLRTVARRLPSAAAASARLLASTERRSALAERRRSVFSWLVKVCVLVRWR